MINIYENTKRHLLADYVNCDRVVLRSGAQGVPCAEASVIFLSSSLFNVALFPLIEDFIVFLLPCLHFGRRSHGFLSAS